MLSEQVMKRWGDKVDAGIAALLAFLGVLLYSARLWILWDTELWKSFCKTALSFSGPKLACVPMECPTDPLNPNVRNMFYIIVVWQCQDICILPVCSGLEPPIPIVRARASLLPWRKLPPAPPSQGRSLLEVIIITIITPVILLIFCPILLCMSEDSKRE